MPFLTGYTKRKAITIQNTYVDSDLTNFPLLVKLVNDADIGANIDSNGYNIRFTDSDGTTLLKYERQSGFSNSGSLANGNFWVKVPSILASGGGVIYIYYKSASPVDGADPTNVWDSNFAAVYHLEEDPSGSAPQILDSTANNNDGTSAGSMTSGDLVAAQVGNGLNFDGSNDYISVPSSTNLTSLNTTFSVELVMKQASSSSLHGYVSHALDNSAGWTVVTNGDFALYDGTTYRTSAYGLSVGVTYYLAVTVSGSTSKFYVKSSGVDYTNTDSYTSRSDTGCGIALGRFWINTNSFYFPGLIDEVRISSIVRPDAWLKFTYHNMFESDNEISFGSQETGGGSIFNIAWIVLKRLFKVR